MAVHLFAGAGYYPLSGLGDYVGPFDELIEAEEEGLSRITTARGDDWYTIIEEQDGRLVTLRYNYRTDH